MERFGIPGGGGREALLLGPALTSSAEPVSPESTLPDDVETAAPLPADAGSEQSQPAASPRFTGLMADLMSSESRRTAIAMGLRQGWIAGPQLFRGDVVRSDRSATGEDSPSLIEDSGSSERVVVRMPLEHPLGFGDPLLTEKQRGALRVGQSDRSANGSTAVDQDAQPELFRETVLLRDELPLN